MNLDMWFHERRCGIRIGHGWNDKYTLFAVCLQWARPLFIRFGTQRREWTLGGK